MIDETLYIYIYSVKLVTVVMGLRCYNFGIKAGIRSLGKVFGRKVKKMIVGSLYSFEF